MAKNAKRDDVVDVLERQHVEIRRLFRQASLPGPWRRQAFDRLVRLLAVHEAAEEAHVHPMVRHALPGGRLLAKARRGEEKQAKRLLAELWHIGPGGDDYGRTLRALRRAVLAHAAREEREEFPALRAEVNRPRLRMLAVEVRLTQALAPTRPHRWANNELANKLAAPVLGPFDRGRDMARRVLLHR